MFIAFAIDLGELPRAKSDRTIRSIDTDGSPASIFATLD
jgi:hypothetical protein